MDSSCILTKFRLVGSNALLVLKLCLHVIDSVGGLDLQHNRRAGEHLHKYLHGDEGQEGGFIPDAVVRKSVALGRYFPYHVDGVDLELKGIVDSDGVDKLGRIQDQCGKGSHRRASFIPPGVETKKTNVKGGPSLYGPRPIEQIQREGHTTERKRAQCSKSIYTENQGVSIQNE